MEFPEKLFYKIGEVCRIADIQPHVLRYWEGEFPSLKPSKNSAGQRVYRAKDVRLVLAIRRLLYEEKFTISGAKKKLRIGVAVPGDRVAGAGENADTPEIIPLEPPGAAAQDIPPPEGISCEELRSLLAGLREKASEVLEILRRWGRQAP